MLKGILFHINGVLPKKEYRMALMVDCSGRMESEYRLVQEDTKEQESLNLTAILLFIKEID